MMGITLPNEIQAILSKLSEQTELYDGDGNLIGVFTPTEQAEELLVKQAREIFDLDEAERRLQSGEKTFTTKEVLDHLKSLETQK